MDRESSTLPAKDRGYRLSLMLSLCVIFRQNHTQRDGRGEKGRHPSGAGYLGSICVVQYRQQGACGHMLLVIAVIFGLTARSLAGWACGLEPRERG